MDWKVLFCYLKFLAGVGVIIMAYLTEMKFKDLIIVIGTGIIVSSGVKIQIKHDLS